MAKARKSKEEEKAEKQRLYERKHLEKKYQQRFSMTKMGKEAGLRGDYRTMVTKYNEYLKILKDTYEVGDIFDLKPDFFDKKKQATELLVISQLFWELAKVYDKSAELKNRTKKCLDMFVRFTANQPFQVVNSEILRKQLKKGNFKNKELFVNASKQIFMESSKCFIATYSLGETHFATTELRKFKSTFMHQGFMLDLGVLYYRLSPNMIQCFQKFPKVMKIVNLIVIRPSLNLLSLSVWTILKLNGNHR